MEGELMTNKELRETIEAIQRIRRYLKIELESLLQERDVRESFYDSGLPSDEVRRSFKDREEKD
jgi:hypothetical protein